MKLKELKLWKLNILDIAIILVIVLMGAIFVYTKFNNNGESSIAVSNNSLSTKFVYDIEIKGISSTSEQMIMVGDDVYDKVSGTCIGKITNIVTMNAKGLIKTVNGNYVLAEMPNKIDVRLTIETDGAVKNGEYLANGLIRILVGNYKEIKTKYLMCSGTIVSIEK